MELIAQIVHNAENINYGLNTEISTDINFLVRKDFQSMKPLGFDMSKDEDYY